jgi:tRNA/rRNA methyltransferase
MKAKPWLRNVAVVLVRPSHPGNIGAAARALKTMGLADLILVAPRRFPQADARAMAAGAADVVDAARVVRSLAEALADRVLAVGFSSRGRDLSHPALSWREMVAEVLGKARSEPVALVFGNETYGLSNEELLACQRFATIPANPAYPSLNLGAAVQVACYELAQAANTFSPPPRSPRMMATGAEIEGLHAHLMEAMAASGFLDPAKPKRLPERLRRLFARADLEREEIDILRGMIASLSSPKKRKRT